MQGYNILIARYWVASSGVGERPIRSKVHNSHLNIKASFVINWDWVHKVGSMSFGQAFEPNSIYMMGLNFSIFWEGFDKAAS
jgi:hypothetical protein